MTGLGSGCSGASSEVVSSGSTLRQMNSPKRHANAQQRPLSLPPKPQIKFLRKTKSLSTPNGSKQGKSMIFFLFGFTYLKPIILNCNVFTS